MCREARKEEREKEASRRRFEKEAQEQEECILRPAFLGNVPYTRGRLASPIAPNRRRAAGYYCNCNHVKGRNPSEHIPQSWCHLSLEQVEPALGAAGDGYERTEMDPER